MSATGCTTVTPNKELQIKQFCSALPIRNWTELTISNRQCLTRICFESNQRADIYPNELYSRIEGGMNNQPGRISLPNKWKLVFVKSNSRDRMKIINN